MVASVTTSPDAAAPRAAEESPLIESPLHLGFVLAYAANLTLVISNSALFVFAEWVRWVCLRPDSGVMYREEIPGSVVQIGLFAAMGTRLFLGRWIDRFGVRRVWMVACLTTICGEVGFFAIRSWSPLIYGSRMLFATGVAAMFTCSAAHMMSQVADYRRTEFLALLGSSGFIGMIVGPQLAGILKWSVGGDPAQFFPLLFGTVIGLNVLTLLLVGTLTRTALPPACDAARPSLLRLMRRYWPGLTVLVAMVKGATFTVLSVFLVRFTEHQGLSGIAWFWTCYAIAAFVMRLRCATLTQQHGRYRVLLWGMLFQALGLWALIPVTRDWHVVGSAVLGGVGHALVFPSMLSLGSGRFPAKYRGSGTNLTLGFVNLGSALSAPSLGWIIDLPAFDGAGFRQMFLTAGSVPFVVAVIWYLRHRACHDEQEMRPAAADESPQAAGVPERSTEALREDARGGAPPVERAGTICGQPLPPRAVPERHK